MKFSAKSICSAASIKYSRFDARGISCKLNVSDCLRLMKLCLKNCGAMEAMYATSSAAFPFSFSFSTRFVFFIVFPYHPRNVCAQLSMPFENRQTTAI